MTKFEKLLARFITKPTDFTMAELEKLLANFGYTLISGGKTGGSRIRFVHNFYPPITMHKPHPKPILKRYQLSEVFKLLKEEKLL